MLKNNTGYGMIMEYYGMSYSVIGCHGIIWNIEIKSSVT
jgi:hypothetical protein